MILTPEQRQAALSGGDVSEAGRRARGSMISDLWPGGVVYYTIEKELSKFGIVAVCDERDELLGDFILK